MDRLVKQSIEEARAKEKTSVPWPVDEPYAQPYYTFNNGVWKACTPNSKDTPANPVEPIPDRLALYSWNIDFMLPFPDSRMHAAVTHLRRLIGSASPTTSASEPAVVIFLQECTPSDLRLLAAHTWIRQTFHLTDLDASNWQSGHYGTVTLLDRRVAVRDCFRIHYARTHMQRDALVADIALSRGVVRLCNTHLESLALEPPLRPAQMRVAAVCMKEGGGLGAVLAGDLNAIQEFDRTLHSENDLKDAYLETGGSEDDAVGHTWGQQAATVQREKFGTSRMDKVFFCGDIRLESFERIGAGVMVENREEREQIVALGFDEPWITDHLGVKAIFSVQLQPRPDHL